MNAPTPHDRSLSASELDEVIACCDRFETAWGSGAVPRIEDELTKASDAVRARLFRELLALEIELRQKRGDSPSKEEFTALSRSCRGHWRCFCGDRPGI